MQSHKTVLIKEAVDALALSKTSTVVDATLGAGGHANAITEILGDSGVFVGIDSDENAIRSVAEDFREKKCTTHLHVENFRNIDSILKQFEITEVDAVLADLGWRMEQFSGNGKGFSFMVDEPLIMTYGNPNDYHFVARDIVNEWKEEDLINIFKGYGEERYAKRIAGTISKKRKDSPIQTTFELVEAIKEATPTRYHHGRIHPATRVFQALRITVNDELESLELFIKESISLLRPKGRLAIISFHSLEDRIVKHLFRNFAHDQIGRVLTKKPITASEEEIETNRRARSAKLRIFEKNE